MGVGMPVNLLALPAIECISCMYACLWLVCVCILCACGWLIVYTAGLHVARVCAYCALAHGSCACILCVCAWLACAYTVRLRVAHVCVYCALARGLHVLYTVRLCVACVHMYIPCVRLFIRDPFPTPAKTVYGCAWTKTGNL